MKNNVIRTIAVDDEIFALQYLKNIASEIKDVELSALFSNPYDALAYLKENDIDAVFLDIEMPGFTGLQLAEIIRKTCPNTQIVFITAFDQYGLEAYDTDARMMLLKPFSALELSNTINKIRREIKRKSVPNIITFNEFNICYKEFVVLFSDEKIKELLALIVDKEGEELSVEEGISHLYPEVTDFYMMYTYSLVLTAKLIFDLDKVGLTHIIKLSEGSISLNVDEVNCDYYEYKKVNVFVDKVKVNYMPEYSWSK